MISGKVTDNLSGVAAIYYGKDSSSMNLYEGSIDSEGNYEITIVAQDYKGGYELYCMDNAGNKSDFANVSVKMDNTCPSNMKVKVAGSTWSNIVNAITFGLFYNEEQTITISADENLSGVQKIEYIEKNVTPETTFTKSDLEGIAAEEWTAIYTASADSQLQANADKDITIAADAVKNIVILAKVTDYAGNVTYATSDGMIFDTKNPTPTGTNNKLVYPANVPSQTVPNTEKALFGKADVIKQDNKDVVPFIIKVNEDTVDGVLQSGIKSVDYTVEASDRGTEETTNKTQGDNLFTRNSTEDLKTSFEQTVYVDAASNNYNYVKINVKVVDNAGNVTEETYEFAIDITTPTISIKYDNNTPVGYEGKGKRGYFEADRTLTVTYTERSENWNRTAAEDVLNNTLAKDKDNADVAEAYSISWTDIQGVTSDADTHVATVKFVGDNTHYTVEKPSCTDAAGNTATEVTEADGTKYPYIFSIDKATDDDSNATISFMKTSWTNKFISNITFGVFDNALEKVGLFTNKDEEVKVSVTDDFAGIYNVMYVEKEFTEGTQKPAEITTEMAENYLKEGTGILGNTDDKVLSGEKNKTITNAKNKNVVIFVSVEDYAGHKKYYSSDGLIVDTTNPASEVKTEKENETALVYPKKLATQKVPSSKRPLYGLADVNAEGKILFNVEVSEKTLERKVGTVDEKVLQSGIQTVQYKIAVKDRATSEVTSITKEETLFSWDKSPVLETSYAGSIAVDAANNNYNYVDLTVTVLDNAGNKIEETYEFAIDITTPEVNVLYDNNRLVAEDDEQGYFNAMRTATITYTERSENWNVKMAEKNLVTALDIRGQEVANAYSISWVDTEGEVADMDTHTATIKFTTTENGGHDARYDIDTTYTDEAGNKVTPIDNVIMEETVYPFKFTIDTVDPEVVKIEYKNKSIKDRIIEALTFRFYNENETVIVTAKDNTSNVVIFDYEGILDEDISTKNKAILRTALEQASIVQQTQKNLFVAEFSIPKKVLSETNSFRGTIKVKAYDYCSNTNEKQDDKHIVLDKIAPKCSVEFSDNEITPIDGVTYHNKPFTATITIDEANFYEEDVQILVNDSKVESIDWVQEGDIWTKEISFEAEDDYILKVNYTDRSGNEMEPYESEQHTLDETNPVIAIQDIKHDSANNGKVIGFKLTVTDKNIRSEEIAVALNVSVRKGNDETKYRCANEAIAIGKPVASQNGKGETVYTYTVKNLDVDGYYTLTCHAKDNATNESSDISANSGSGNNVTVEKVNFSVNRNGSTYWTTATYNGKKDFDLDGAYVNGDVTIEIHEINIDKLDLTEKDKTVITISDGNQIVDVELKEGDNYEKNISHAKGALYENIYTLKSENFKNDGEYTIGMISHDRATNNNTNTEERKWDIASFTVDATKPVITSNVTKNQIIEANEYDVEFRIADANLDEESIDVKVDGKQVQYQATDNGTYVFTVKNLTKKDISIAAKDLAGNESENYLVESVTVSTNIFVRWYANTKVFWLTIGGIVCVGGCGIFFIFRRRIRATE